MLQPCVHGRHPEPGEYCPAFRLFVACLRLDQIELADEFKWLFGLPGWIFSRFVEAEPYMGYTTEVVDAFQRASGTTVRHHGF